MADAILEFALDLIAEVLEAVLNPRWERFLSRKLRKGREG